MVCVQITIKIEIFTSEENFFIPNLFAGKKLFKVASFCPDEGKLIEWSL